MSERPIAIVTGGAGFIGSHMVDLLIKKGFAVRVIDNLIGGREANLAHHKNDPVTLDQRDIRTIAAQDAIFRGAQYIFHFAGIGDIVPSIDRPVDYMSTNVMGTVSALEGARAANIKKFVYAASSSCYGVCEEVPTAESAPIQPMYPYALSKYQGEQAVFHWNKVYRLPANAIRIFNAYGTRSKTTGAYGAVFGVFLKQKIANQSFTIVGDGTQTRDFIFVTDVARAFYAAAVTEKVGEVFNAGAGNPQSINQLIALLGGGHTEYLPWRPGEPRCTWADITKITSTLDWRPEVSFAEGVSRMLAELDYWRDAPLWNRSSIEDATRGWFNTFQN